MQQVLNEHTDLSTAERAWLEALVRQWQPLADVSFADLVLWVPDVDDNVFWAAAQVRPNTGPTALEEDVVGEDISYDPEALVTSAYLSQEILSTSDHNLSAGIPVAVQAIPVIRNDRVIAIVEKHTNEMGVRAPGALEDAYLDTAELLTYMLWRGEYPVTPRTDPTISPRVGDGLMVLDESGRVTYASPNAVSAWRQLGGTLDLHGEELRSLLVTINAAAIPAENSTVSLDRSSEFTLETNDTAIRMRIMPLRGDGREGTLVLCRDISDIRDRDRELVNKDATIREIHHRVKNNLQTVAALLRLQSRRAESAKARDALSDANRRVQSIAKVHEILSQSFDEQVEFDQIADQILQMVGDVAASRGLVHARREGSFGLISAESATALSLVMTELCQNGIEHGLRSGSGELVVRVTGDSERLCLEVIDNGKGLPDDFSIDKTSSLGLSIVRTLVQDLDGEFEIVNNDQSAPFQTGATARVRLPRRPNKDNDELY